MTPSPLRHARPLSIALLALGACAPVVTHGPRVEPGFHLVGTVSAPAGGCDSACAGIGRMGVGGRHGWVPTDPAKPAFLVGASIPGIDISSPEVDLYAQGPGRDRAFAYGAGVLAAPRHLMPYVEAGRDVLGGTAVYASLGYAWLLKTPDAWFESPDDEGLRPPRYWQPAVHLRVPLREGVSAEAFAAGAFGRREVRVYDPDSPLPRDERRSLSMVNVGVNFSWHPTFRVPRFPPMPPHPRLPPTGDAASPTP